MRGEVVRGRDRGRDLRVVTLEVVGIGNAVAVGKRPAVEAAFLDLVQLAGRKVVSEQVAVIVRRPETAVGAPREPDRVAQPGRVDLLVRAIEIVARDRGPARIVLNAHVAARTDRDVEPLVRTDRDRARPVTTSGRESLDHGLDRTGHRARVRVEPHPAHRAGLRHVQPPLVHGQAVRKVQLLEQDPRSVGAAVPVGVALQQDDPALAG